MNQHQDVRRPSVSLPYFETPLFAPPNPSIWSLDVRVIPNFPPTVPWNSCNCLEPPENHEDRHFFGCPPLGHPREHGCHVSHNLAPTGAPPQKQGDLRIALPPLHAGIDQRKAHCRAEVPGLSCDHYGCCFLLVVSCCIQLYPLVSIMLIHNVYSSCIHISIYPVV